MKFIVENEWFRVVFKDENKVVAILSGEGYSSWGQTDYLVKCIEKQNVSKVHLVFDYYYCKYHEITAKYFETRIISLLRLIYNNNPKVRVIIHMCDLMKRIMFQIEHYGYVTKRRDVRYIPTILTDISHNNALWFRVGNDHNKQRYLSITIKNNSIIVEDDIMPERAIKESKGGINQ